MMATYTIIVISLKLLLTRISAQDVINTAQGKIRGAHRDGFVSYQGIPYGSIGGDNGRFKHAGLAPTWTDVRESNEIHCYTSSPVEDCLQLDVHVPPGSNLPVLAWVTGGSGRYNPSLLVKQGIVVVTIRHRLGAVGFLCLGEDKIPGNAGLKDVVLALRWVRDNIIAFHGNPDKVIVAGQSFGAALVESLMLTPMATGLFHGAILQSGTVLAPWAFNYDAENRAKFLKMNFDESKDMHFLNKVGIADLAGRSEDLEVPYLPFGVCIEKPLKSQERLLSQAPFDIMSTGNMSKVPMIVGYTNNEAYVFASMLKSAKALAKMSKGMEFLLPSELQTNKRDVPQLVNKVHDMYFEGNMTMASLLAYHRDAYFLGHIHRSVRLHASFSDSVYYYQFSYLGNVGVEGEPGVIKTGAAHSDELAYLFPAKGEKLEDEDGIVQENIVRLWTNFVKHLNPTPESEHFLWEPVNPHDVRLLDINVDLNMIDFPHKRKTQMWKDIYEKYYFENRRSSAQ
ncbi:carboxylesterase 5A-like [Vanessa cardui]|uniref:carboxylesterase 5A-like n=1 Tax=Vanessa cardui TaxID=171605 RepID=UPI001F131974|nr:carboxylesterase 5A-like [Vanessa cardui]